MTESIPSKTELRTRLRRTLVGVTPGEWQSAAVAVSTRLLEQDAIAGAKAVMIYNAMPNEVDLGIFAQEMIRRGAKVCLPKVDWLDKSITPMEVRAWPPNLVDSRHSLREPGEGPSVAARDLGVVLVPGLAFTDKGARLGRGAGFYDRFLTRPELTALKVGIGLDEQVVPAVPTDEWDVPLDAVCTPTRWLA